MIKSFMLSFLARQHLVLGKRFVDRYPHSWLVWEPAAWKVQPLNPAVLETQLPDDRRRPSAPGDGDALCFQLVAKPGTLIKVGRAETNEIIVTDVTVSREHCTIHLAGTRWVVTGCPSVKSLVVAGMPHGPGKDATLLSGDLLLLGEVRFTYYDGLGFAQRVGVEADKLSLDREQSV